MFVDCSRDNVNVHFNSGACIVWYLYTSYNGKKIYFSVRRLQWMDFVWCVLQADFCDVCKDIVEYLQTYADSNATEVSHM